MKQKVFFLLTLLIWGGISISARNINADLSKGIPSNGATWAKAADSDTYTFTWSNWGSEISLFEAFGGSTVDWSGLTKIDMTISRDVNPVITIAIVADGKSYTCTPYSGGARTFNLSNFKTNDQKVLTATETGKITDIKFLCPQMENTLSATVSNVFVTISPKATLAFDADGKATIDLSKAEAYGGATCMYEAGAGLTITSDGTAGSYIEVVFDKTYDFTNIASGLITYSGADITYLKKEDNNDIQGPLVFNGSGHGGFYGSRFSPTFAGEIAKGNYTAVTGVKLHLNSVGEMIISDFTLTASPMKVAAGTHYTPIEDLPHYTNAGNGIEGATVGSPIETYYNNKDNIVVIGNGSGDPVQYIDIDGYDELRIYTDDSGTRVWYYYVDDNNAVKNNTGIYLSDASLYSYNSAEGYYYAKIEAIKNLLNGHAKVIGVKKSAAGKLCSKIILYKEKIDYDYIVSGQYSDAVSLDEIANSDACTIDCTGLTGADVKIGSKNPNCIIAVKKEGVVSATKNLAVNGKIANLELTDGHSVKIPAGMTATTAKYTRTMTNTYGTIVLPFDAASDDNMEFYTISAMDANSITIEEVTTLAAGTPAIIKKLVSDDITINGNGSTLNGNINNTTGAVNMFGSYTQDEKIADENAYYILDNKFWQCNEYFYCDAFRAYFTPAAGAPAANCLSLKESFGNPTLVNIVTGNTANGIQGVYNTAGVKMQGLQKGINIVRLASGETKTVIIK